MTDEACFNACFETEDPACSPCLDQAIGACYTMNGCAQQYGDITCCATDAGCAPSDGACVMSNCGPEITAFNTCANGVEPSACGPSLGACIMSGM